MKHQKMVMIKLCNRKRIAGWVLALTVGSHLMGCTLDFSRLEYRRAETSAEKGQFPKAIKYFKKVINRDPESPLALKSARAASKIALLELGDFDLAAQMYRHIVAHSTNSNERKLAQKDLADLFFEKKADYHGAIVEYNKLMTLGTTQEELLKYKLRIARSHFYISEFFQAESEVNDALKVAEKGRERFELEVFLANIYFNTKRLEQATKSYRRILEDYPTYSKESRVDMSLVVTLEESEDFRSAIDLLKTMRPEAEDPEFIDLKISKLEERIRNLPGARGLRK